MTTSDILPQLLQLSRNDQLIITDALLRALHNEKPETREQFMAELDHRVEDMKDHPESAILWDDLDEELENL